LACGFQAVVIGTNPRATHVGAFAVYGAGLLATVFASAAYNMSGDRPHRGLLRRLDHSAIFLMIAGTCTPISVVAIGGTPGMKLLGTVWTVAMLGVADKLVFQTKFERPAIVVYLVLGWIGILAIDDLVAALTPHAALLLAAEGLVFSLGVPVHLATQLPYKDALWHALVIVATACHYLMIVGLAMPPD